MKLLHNGEIDMDRDQWLCSIRNESGRLGDVEIKDGKIVTDGQLGHNEYRNFIDLLKGLQGFSISIDDIFF